MITVQITTEELEMLDACIRGVRIFKEQYDGKYVSNWSVPDQVDLLTNEPLCRYIGWAQHEGILPLFSIARARIPRANVTRLSIFGGTIIRTVFDETAFLDVRLSSVDLSLTTFDSCNIYSMTLVSCNIFAVRFRECSINNMRVACHEIPRFMGCTFDNLTLEFPIWFDVERDIEYATSRLEACSGTFKVYSRADLLKERHFTIEPNGTLTENEYEPPF